MRSLRNSYYYVMTIKVVFILCKYGQQTFKMLQKYINFLTQNQSWS